MEPGGECEPLSAKGPLSVAAAASRGVPSLERRLAALQWVAERRSGSVATIPRIRGCNTGASGTRT